MFIYLIKYKQKIPTSFYKGWDFYTSPQNLKQKTQGYIGFKIRLNEFSIKMNTSLRISCKMSLLLRIKMNWARSFYLQIKKLFFEVIADVWTRYYIKKKIRQIFKYLNQALNNIELNFKLCAI